MEIILMKITNMLFMILLISTLFASEIMFIDNIMYNNIL